MIKVHEYGIVLPCIIDSKIKLSIYGDVSFFFAANSRVIGADVVESQGDTMKHVATIVKMAILQVSSQLHV